MDVDVTPVSYGADPTGVKDSTEALQLCIEACVNQSLASIKLEAENLQNVALQDIMVRVDGGNSAENFGTYRECHEDNNEEWWGAKACEP